LYTPVVADNLFVVQFNSVKLLKLNAAIISGGVKLRAEIELSRIDGNRN